ncbi:MAG: hypothetical protein U0802_05980 [Candidatus Binatia bacterium]
MVVRGGSLVVGALALLGGTPALAASNPNAFCVGDPCVINADVDADPNVVLDFGTRTVVLQKQLNMLPAAGGALGTLTIRCGTFRVAGSGFIRGSAAGSGGGQVTIEARNGIELNGTTTLGDVRLTGQDAGHLTLTTAMGSITGSGRLNLGADGVLASAGTLTAISAADILLSGPVTLAGGTQGSGGTLELQAAGNIVLSGFLDLTGGQGGGGFVDVTTPGALTVTNLDLSGSSEFGDAGLATLDGGTVTVGTLFGRGAADGENCGDGADIDVFATGDAIFNGTVDIRGRGLDCSGGFLSIDGARVFLNSPLLMSGDGSEADGGDFDVSATTLIQLASSGTIDMTGGTGGAGDVSLQSNGDIVIAGTVSAYGRSSGSPGASLVDINAGGKLTVSGTVDSSGGSAALGGGGDLNLTGCKVDTATTAVLRSLGDAGSIEVVAHDRLTLRGNFQAGSGGISVQYGPRAVPPTVAAFFTPATTAVLNPLITPCRVCDTDAECNDGNQCTTDTCPPDGSACSNAPRSGACTDDNACTVGDACVSGSCVPGPAPDCADSTTCTIDSCLPTTGCIHFPIPGSCDDGNSCTTGDQCVIGVCVGTAPNCDDHNPCTDDTCNQFGCLHTFNTSACNDNNLCTTADACFQGACAGTAISCDDADPCTTDSCAQSAGCQHIGIPGCADSDGDGKLDDADECTTLAWTSPPTMPPDQFPKGFGLVASHLASPDGQQSLLVKGAFNVATPSPAVDPAANGVHLYAADATGALFDVSLPAGPGCASGDGWTTGGDPSHRIWKYRNRSGALPPACVPGSARGLGSLQIKDARQASKQALQFKVKAKAATLLRTPSLPLTRIQVSLALGAQPSPGVASQQARIGQCAESLFTGNPISTVGKPACKPRVKNSQLDGATCKGR